MRAKDFFNIDEIFRFKGIFDRELGPWEWVKLVGMALEGVDFSQSERYKIPPGLFVGEKVFFERGVKLPHFGTIEGPAYIGEGSELRPGVYIRQNVIVGKRCVLGNSCEFKNCLLLNDVQAPHFNYVGDSILGNHSHLGAGVILANLRLDSQPIRVKTLNGFIDTGMRKLGAVLGDSAQVACNSVLNPGTLVKPHQHVLPRR